MKIGILGGAFDPPHNGHLALARTGLEKIGLDKILFIPTKTPPHKTVKSGMGPGLRLFLTRLAVCDIAPEEACRFLSENGIFTNGSPEMMSFQQLYEKVYRDGLNIRFEVSDIEISRTSDLPSYTFDTVALLLNKNPGWEITLIIGTDQAAVLDTWYRIDDLSRLVKFAVAGREHDDIASIRRKFPYIEPFEFPHMNISSTLIRELIRTGKPIAEYVPEQIEPILTSLA